MEVSLLPGRSQNTLSRLGDFFSTEKEIPLSKLDKHTEKSTSCVLLKPVIAFGLSLLGQSSKLNCQNLFSLGLSVRCRS